MSIGLENRNFSLGFSEPWGRPSSLRRPGDRFDTEWLATPRNLVLMAKDRSIGFGVLQATVEGPEGWSLPVRWPSPDAPPADVVARDRSVTVRGAIDFGPCGLAAAPEHELRPPASNQA